MEEPPEQYRIDDIHQPGQNVEAETRFWGPNGLYPHVRTDLRNIYELRRDFATLLGCPNKTGFLGAQPVSFSRKSLDELRREDYFVCEKSDGVRYLLWLTADKDDRECQYLIDRKNQYWHVKTGALHMPLPENHELFHRDSVFDGELVIDVERDGSRTPRFLVFDCLALDGMRLMERTLDKRLAYFQERVDKPYQSLFSRFPQELEFQAFLVEPKKMEFSYGVPVLFRDTIPRLKHGNDGLIFTCRTSGYVFGTDRHILKWKPPHENTIDFRMRLHFPTVTAADEDEAGEGDRYVDYDSVPRAELFAHKGGGQPPERVGDLHITPDEWETLKSLGDPLNDRVVECYLDDDKRWRLYRFRDDKHEANHVSVVQKVLESIEDGVTQQELIEAHDSIKRAWKDREAAQRGAARR